MHSPLTLTTALTALTSMASGAPGSELGRTSRRSGPILRNPVSVTYEYASSIRAFSASFRRSSVPDKVGDCVRSCYNEAAMTFDSALTIRDTPSTIPYTTYTPPKTIATTPTNRMASTTPTCTTTLYTEPVITFGPTSTAWADTITSVRSVDCSGCDLAVLYGGHIYQEVKYTTTVNVDSATTEYTAECMISPSAVDSGPGEVNII